MNAQCEAEFHSAKIVCNLFGDIEPFDLPGYILEIRPRNFLVAVDSSGRRFHVRDAGCGYELRAIT